MSHLFKELQKLEKRANMPGQDPAQAPGSQPPGSPGQPIPPNMAAPPGTPPLPVQQSRPWVGPNVTVFENAKVPMPPDPNAMLSAVMTELVKQHSFLGKYPMEPRISTTDKGLTLGEIYIANEMGVPVLIPFVVKDGVLKPMVAVMIGEELKAIGDEADFQQVLEPPMPVGAAGPVNTDSKMKLPDLAFGGPGGEGGGSMRQRQAVLGGLGKQASMASEMGGTGLAHKLATLLDVPPTVVQFERRDFGCIVKQASLIHFDPVVREVPLTEVPEEVMKGFSKRPFVTVPLIEKEAHENASLPAGASVAVDPDTHIKGVEWRYDYKHETHTRAAALVPGGGVEMEIDGKKYRMRVFTVADSDSTLSLLDRGDRGISVEKSPTWKPQQILAVASDGHYIEHEKDYKALKGKKLKERPRVGMAINEAFQKNVGTYGFLVDFKKNMAYGPVELLGGGKMLYKGLMKRTVVSSKVKKLTPGETNLYIPSTFKFVVANKKLEPEKLEKTSSLTSRIEIQDLGRNAVRLSGDGISGVSWGDENLNGSEFSYADAVFVLGAMGVPEGQSLPKIASAKKHGKSQVEVPYRLTAFNADDYDVNFGFLKLATAIPPEEDNLLAIQFMGSDTLDKFMGNLDALRSFADDLAVLTLHAQIGLGPVDDEAPFQALKNLREVIKQLETLDAQRQMSQGGTTQ